MLVLQPLRESDSQHNEHSQWHLHQMVRAIQVGARSEVVRAEVPKKIAVEAVAQAGQNTAPRFQKCVENREACLPSDVRSADEQEQCSYKHPEITAPNGVFFLGAFNILAIGFDCRDTKDQ